MHKHALAMAVPGQRQSHGLQCDAGDCAGQDVHRVHVKKFIINRLLFNVWTEITADGFGQGAYVAPVKN